MLAFESMPGTATFCRGIRPGVTLNHGKVVVKDGISGAWPSVACPYASRRASALPAISEMVGASEETGGVFDPLGFATDEVGIYCIELASIMGLS